MIFNSILHDIKTQNDLSDSTLMSLEDICLFWESVTDSTVATIKEITAKYSYENLSKLRRPGSTTTHLHFWKDVGQYGLTPALDDHDIDHNYIHFVKDVYDSVTLRNPGEINYPEQEIYHDSVDRLFYTWVGYIWQEADGKSAGIPTCTLENNSVRMFYLNDFLFSAFSTYHDRWDDKRIEGSAFTRKLKPEEIFARTNRNFRWLDREIIWQLKREDETITLAIRDNITTESAKSTANSIQHKPSQNYDNSREVAVKYFIQRCDEYINQQWQLRELKNK